MKDYVVIFKAKELTLKQAARLTAESIIRAKEIAPDCRNIVSLILGRKDKKN